MSLLKQRKQGNKKVMINFKVIFFPVVIATNVQGHLMDTIQYASL